MTSTDQSVPLNPNLDPQSTTTNSVTSFDDEAQPVLGVLTDSTGITAPTPDEIKQYLARPYRVGTFAWTSASALTSYNLASLWRALALPMKKVSGFMNFRGDMHVKFTVDATPYHYGVLLCSALPFYGGLDQDTFANFMPATRASQLISLQIHPGQNLGGELVLPFVWPFPFLNLRNTAGFADINKLIINPIVPLLRADGVAAGTVPVDIYVWWDNVELATPTDYVATSGMRATQSPLTKVEPSPPTKPSKVFNAIGSAAAALSVIPVVGTTFSVISQVASGVGSALAFFGWSRPGQSATVSTMTKRYLDNMSNCDVVDFSQNLALSAQQSTDSGTRFLSGPTRDPLAIATIAGIDSFFGVATWLTTAAAGTMLIEFPVSPFMASVSPTSDFCPTAIGAASTFFTSWSGSIIYRVKLVCTVFHKGRLIVYHQPDNILYGVPTGTTEYTTNNCIIDIDSDTCVDFVVTNQQQSPILRQRWLVAETAGTAPAGYFVTGATGVTSYDNYDNGRFVIKVQSPLLAPVAGASAYVMVSVRAGPDFALHDPSGGFWQDSGFRATSGLVPGTNSAPPTSKAPDRCELVAPLYSSDFREIYFGESVVSLRQIIKRYEFESYVPLYQAATNSNWFQSTISVDVVADPVVINLYDPVAAYPASVSAQPFNVILPTALSIVVACFAGYRGSMRIKAVPMVPTTATDIAIYYISRCTYLARPATFFAGKPMNYTVYSDPVNQTGVGGAALWYTTAQRKWFINGAAGMSAFSARDAGEVQVPYTDSAVFHYPSALYVTTAPGSSFCSKVRLTRQSNGTAAFVLQDAGFDLFKAAGDDFNVFHWVGMPVISAHRAYIGPVTKTGITASR